MPLVALPIIIHLINQRRYQTTRWAAMMFLLAANRMSRGYARLRQWLILLFRMPAIAGLVFAVSRPLASGWLGLAAGGRADTTIILLDCSPSMQQREAGGGISKLETGPAATRADARARWAPSRWVLIDSATNQPRELRVARALLDLSRAEPTSAEADLAGDARSRARLHPGQQDRADGDLDLLRPSRERLARRQRPLADACATAFSNLAQGVRFHLLAYPQTAPDNLAVRVTGVRRQQTRRGRRAAGLAASCRAKGRRRQGERSPCNFEIEGAPIRSDRRDGRTEYELKDHRIPLERNHERGWGRVSIPADANPADNDFYFVFDKPAPRKAIIVAEDPQAAWPLQLAAAISPDPAVECAAEVVAAEQLAAVDWEQVALLLWQAPLPEGDAAKLVQAFVDRGGQVIFFPPRSPGSGEFLGVRWTTGSIGAEEIAVETWRGDQDLLAHTQSGGRCRSAICRSARYCGLSGEFTALATLRGGAPLLARVDHEHRAASTSVTTTPAAGRLVAGGRRRRALRRWCSEPWPRGRRSGQHPQPDRRPTPPAKSREPGSAWRATEAACRPIIRCTGEFTRRATGCWPSIAPPPRTRRRCWTTTAWPGSSGGWTSPASTTRRVTSAR